MRISERHGHVESCSGVPWCAWHVRNDVFRCICVLYRISRTWLYSCWKAWDNCTALFPTFLHLVQGIWVIFSVKADYERLCVAISCAGSPVQILTQDQAAQSVLQDLNKATAKATPKEVGNKGLTDLTCAQCCLLPPPSSANAWLAD